MNGLIDDDFGDIYADIEVEVEVEVEVEAKSVLLSTKINDDFYTNDDTSNNLNSDSKQLNSISDEKLCISEEDNNESDSSDDDDALNIVLNDDDDADCKVFSVANAERIVNQDFIDQDDGDDDDKDPYKHVKPYGSSFPSNRKANDSVGVVSCSSKYARGKWDDGRCKQHEVLSTGQFASIHAASSSVSHGGYCFSLPWYRTILDVDIDAFEEKRWRCPRVDVSDFFNFGFNEDSWKQYCISLEQLRQCSYMHGRSLSQQFSKHTKARETVSEHERAAKETIVEDSTHAGSSMKFVDMGDKLMGLPKGRAIQVEDSTVERQPTMDLRHPHTWDSDVVIQINVQDSNENCSGSNKVEFCHRDNNGHEISICRDVDVNDIKDSDESSVKPLGNIRSFTKGCIQPMSESKHMLLDPDNHAKDQNFDVDYHDQKVNAQTSEHIAEVMKTKQKVEGENAGNTCKSDQCLTETETETELSVGDQSHISLTLSCSGSDSEASRESVYINAEVSDSHLKRLYSGTVQQESVSTDHESPKSNGTGRIPVNSLHNSRNRRSTLWEGRRHEKRGHHKVAERGTHHDTDNDASHMFRDRLSTDFHKQVERLHDFGYHSGEDSSFERERNFSGCYGGDRFAENHVHDVCTKHPRRKYHQRFVDVMKAQDRRNWNKDELHERSLRMDDRDSIDRDWGSGDRGLSSKGMIPFTYRESKGLVSKYKNLKEMDVQRRRKGEKIHHRKKTDVDACLLNRGNEDVDDLMPLTNGRLFPFSSQRRDYLDGKHEADNPIVWRGNLRGRRIQYGHKSPSNLENSWCKEIEDEHCYLDYQHSPSWSHRRFSVANGGSWKDMMPPRRTSFGSRLTERSERHRGEISREKCSDSHWLDNYHDIDNAEDGIVYYDERFYQRRNYSSQSGLLRQMQGESILSQQDDEFYAKRSSCSYEKSSRHAKLRSTHDCMVVDDVQWNRYRIFKGERRVGFLNRNLNMNRGEQGSTARRYSHPADLIFWEGKSSGRSSIAEISMSNGKSERTDMKFTKDRRILKDFNETRTGRPIQTGIAKMIGNQIDERWLDKFPVSKQDGYLDIEEGQIILDNPTTEDRLEKKQASETALLVPNAKKSFHSETETNKRYDDQQILESLAKMEKRRERFKDPIALKGEPDKSMKRQFDSIAETIESKQKRPARKRRWGDS